MTKSSYLPIWSLIDAVFPACEMIGSLRLEIMSGSRKMINMLRQADGHSAILPSLRKRSKLSFNSKYSWMAMFFFFSIMADCKQL